MSGKNLIINADDFGISNSVNRAVLKGWTDGILTSASLMVTGEAFAEAAEIARLNPALQVGLHHRAGGAVQDVDHRDDRDPGGEFAGSPSITRAIIRCLIVARG